MSKHRTSRTVEKSVAHVRQLANGFTIISIPDMETTMLVMNPPDRPLFDFSKCRRMSRGEAHRVVRSMSDATEAQKAAYHAMIDEKPQERGMA